MTRTQKYSNEAIVEAARKMFLEQGPGVSTLDIAKEAGVSEGLLFKRFGTKQELFIAAMGIPQIDISELLKGRLNKGDVRENLFEIMVEIITLFKEAFPRIMMLWSHQDMSIFEEIHGNEDAPPIKLVRAISKYVEEEMRLGRVASVDPMVIARVILGAAMHCVFWEVVGLGRHHPLEAKAYAEKTIEMLWSGIKPKSDPPSTKRRACK